MRSNYIDWACLHNCWGTVAGCNVLRIHPVIASWKLVNKYWLTNQYVATNHRYMPISCNILDLKQVHTSDAGC